MFAKELIKDSALQAGVSPSAAGFLAGAGGGVCQVSVMGPCTFLVTSVVTNKNVSITQQIKSTWQNKVWMRVQALVVATMADRFAYFLSGLGWL